MSTLWSRFVGDYQAAGDRYYSEGKLNRAAEMYARAGNWLEAARAACRAEQLERALSYLDQADDPVAAGDLLASHGADREAIRYYERAGAYWKAGEAALRSNQAPRAAALFERDGGFQRAAECYEQGGAVDDALRAWDKESAKLQQDGQAVEARKVDLHRAQLLGRYGRSREAALLFESIGRPGLAAEMWFKAGEPLRAMERFLEAGEARRAAALLERAGEVDPELRARVLVAAAQHREAAELYLQLGRPRDATDSFEAAGDWRQAAEACREDDPARAGDLFFRAGAFLDAATCFQEAGVPARAAEALARAGRPGRAALCYLEIGRALDAARMFLAAEDPGSAASALRSIEPDREEYFQATLLLAPLLIRSGEGGAVIDRLDLVPHDRASDEEALDVRYWRARALELLGDLEAASNELDAVVQRARDHRDAAKRLLTLRTMLGHRREGSRRSVAGSLEPGYVLQGRYEIQDEIGRGGMSRVYRALDTQLGERLAVKVLYPTAIDAEKAERRMLNEVQLCRRITHPNVVRIYDFGRFECGLFVTMELLDGMTLADLLAVEGRLPIKQVHPLLSEILQGLVAAHQHRVVHRDLKPANIAVTPERAKIMDFGIACVEDGESTLTRTGQVVGSPMYMSPEQIQGLDLDGRSDLYSFGVLAFTLLAGHEPFRASTPTAVSVKHLQEAPPDLRVIRPDLDEGWHRFVTRLLEKDRSFRFDTAEEVLATLRTLPIGVRAVAR
ncbi:MAG TPA: protein kinase [Thermoanaerobaculia bacterium]|nr:protein kinase [Thermoanaerobaculia bacterium]